MNATWSPSTEVELSAAASQRLLGEFHHLDIKRELTAGKGANTELARDLASFGIDGGLLLLGIDEDQDPPALHPIRLAGLPERVEQVALSRIDEPLPVSTTPIPSAANPAEGYLAIRIPPSPLAPHMVDGRYWGRGDKTKYQLSDDEVFRLHERRQRWEHSALELLHEYVERDPTVEREQAHVFIVAEPIGADDGLLLPIIEPPGTSYQRGLVSFRGRALDQPGAPRSEFSPSLDQATAAERRGDGWALTTHSFLQGRFVDPGTRESRVLEAEVSDRGAIRIFSARGSDRQRARRVAIERALVVLPHQALCLVRQVAEEGGYLGSWDLGYAVTGARGIIANTFVQQMLDDNAPAFTEAAYERTTRATLEEIATRPNAVVERLVGRLIRALGVRDHSELRELLD